MPDKRPRSSRNIHDARSGARKKQGRGLRIQSHPFLLATAIILVALVLGYAIQHKTMGPFGEANLDSATLGQALPYGAPGYAPIILNNLVHDTGALQRNGYLYTSLSEFNATYLPANSSYPQTITSVIFVTNSSSLADSTEAGMLFVPGGIGPGADGLYNTSIPYYNYTYKGHSVPIYDVVSIQVYNQSHINNQTDIYPIFQSTALFTLGSVVGFVTINGYKNMSDNVSVGLAEALYRNAVDTGVG